MDEESAAFDRFIQEQTKETRQEWEKVLNIQKLMLEELPYKYKEIGKERYARTWTLHNLYENYDRFRRELMERKPLGKRICRRCTAARIQDIVAGQAGQLEQLTVRNGSSQYEKQRYMLVVIPVCSLICGMAAFWMVRQMNRTASRYIVKPDCGTGS